MSHSSHSKTVSGYFAGIAGWYDFLNHFLSLGQDIYWRRRLVRHIRTNEEGLILDLAAGTMDVTREILKHYPGVKVLALDYTMAMLIKGKKKIRHETSLAAPAQGDARFLPLPDNCVDSVTIAFGIRNITPRAEACHEIFRVLKHGGRLCILEFGTGKKRIWGGLYNFYLTRVLPFVGRAISRNKQAYTYLAETIADFPDSRDLAMEMKTAGFAKIFYYPLSSGIVYVHVGEKAVTQKSSAQDRLPADPE